jgi:hypothetical protein
MTYSTHLITLQKNKKGTFLGIFEDGDGLQITAYVNKNLDRNAFYVVPEEGVEYVALVQHARNGGYFIKQLLPSAFHPLGKILTAKVCYTDTNDPEIYSSVAKDLLLALTKPADENHKKIQYCIFIDQEVNVSFGFNGKSLELDVEKNIEVKSLSGKLVNIRTQANPKFISAVFEDDLGRQIPVSFPQKILFAFPFIGLPEIIYGVTVIFDHEKHSSRIFLEHTRVLLEELIKAKEHTFLFDKHHGHNEVSYFNFQVGSYTLKISALHRDLMKLGIDFTELKEGATLKGMAKVSKPLKDGRWFVNFVLADCQDYEGRIIIERSFEKDGIKHFIFKKIPTDGSLFVIKQTEFFPHGVIDFFEPGGQGNVSIYEFKGEKSCPEWKVKHIDPCWLNGDRFNKNDEQGHCAYEGVSAYDWYAHNKELNSPFGTVIRGLHHYALRNHLVCEVITSGLAQMVFIPAPLLKAKELARLEAGTRIKGEARHVLLDIFHDSHRGWLADNIEVFKEDKDTRNLPKLNESQIETLKFVRQEPSRNKLRVYTFASLDCEQTFRFTDYNKYMEMLPEPERYNFIVKTQPRGQFINIKEILSAELQS